MIPGRGPKQCFYAIFVVQVPRLQPSLRSASNLHKSSVAFVMAQNRSICNGVARAAYACSLAVNCGLVLGLQNGMLCSSSP